MARYQTPPDVHTLTPEQRAALQPGQHITASGARGRWVGQTRHGTDVAAWHGNARASGDPLTYFRNLRAYVRTYA